MALNKPDRKKQDEDKRNYPYYSKKWNQYFKNFESFRRFDNYKKRAEYIEYLKNKKHSPTRGKNQDYNDGTGMFHGPAKKRKIYLKCSLSGCLRTVILKSGGACIPTIPMIGQAIKNNGKGKLHRDSGPDVLHRLS